MSEILNGKRRISKKMGLKIIQKLNIDEERQKNLIDKIDSANSYELLELQDFKILSTWEHFAVLNLLKLRDFIFDSSWMARRLGISKDRVERVLARLFSSGLLKKKNEDEVERVSNHNLRTPTGIKNQALQNYTRQSFERGIDSLTETEVSLRDFSTLTLTMNKKDLPKAKKIIEEFRFKFDKEIERVPGDEVYKLVIGLYPLTKEITNE